MSWMVQVVPMTWARLDMLPEGKFDFFLGSDILYDAKGMVSDLIAAPCSEESFQHALASRIGGAASR